MRNFVILALAFAGAGLSCAHAEAIRSGECLIQVRGKIAKDGPCRITLSPGGSFQTGGERRGEAFAVVSINESSGTAEAYWNGPDRESHAHDPLGAVVRRGGCWVNDTARVCAWLPGTRPR